MTTSNILLVATLIFMSLGLGISFPRLYHSHSKKERTIGIIMFIVGLLSFFAWVVAAIV